MKKSLTNCCIKVILMDLDMPHMSGAEATINIAQMFEDGQITYMPAIIGYSSDTTDEAKLECFEAGMVHLLPKPSPPDAILGIINNYL